MNEYKNPFSAQSVDIDEAISVLREQGFTVVAPTPAEPIGAATPRGLTMVAGGGFQFGLAQWQRD